MRLSLNVEGNVLEDGDEPESEKRLGKASGRSHFPRLRGAVLLERVEGKSGLREGSGYAMSVLTWLRLDGYEHRARGKNVLQAW